ncbi:hypothetical protein ACM40_06925 [Chryseobacterium sp. BLS98]|jgi:PBP1b-binding outer membrane lipoprotein LpoB|uniref:hypothetical protein n=1 Tax=Chryseobacterium sp. BLS98 TaxID=885586 RepID=UPI00065AC47F|nr:hypothetical protein [Chryseobacterium sp. BLS98]KMQ62042.1 hypothetical protein ACM40_06925 [Chryseobacterium sp. BLS98]
MKKLWIGAILGVVFLGSCAQNKEKREEFKDEHNKDSLRNKMGDSAVANSEPVATVQDSSKIKTDTLKAK